MRRHPTTVVRFAWPEEAERYRAEVREWLETHPDPEPRQLAEAGYVAPHWPRPWGREASPLEQLAIDEELRAAGVRRPVNPVGIGWAGPTILVAGTAEQQRRFLPGILDGSELWCQLFSEPDAGSDLAALSTRAVLDGDEWVVTGQKVWSSLAHHSRWGLLLARTDPEAPKHEGISCFACPMDAPGIEVRPLREMTGARVFNEVIFAEARISADCLIGRPGQGWKLARVTLTNERVGLSASVSPWDLGPSADELLEVARRRGGVADPVQRDRVVAVWAEAQVIQMLRYRLVAHRLAGRSPGPEASVQKLLTDLHGRRLFRLGRDLAGAHGLLREAGPFGPDPGRWTYAFTFSPALTIGGGTAEVQRNIVAEQILGLPRDPA